MEYDSDGRYVLFSSDEIEKLNRNQKEVYKSTMHILSPFFRKDKICKVLEIHAVVSLLQSKLAKVHDKVSLDIISSALEVAQLQKKKLDCATIVNKILSALGSPTRNIRYYITLKATKKTFLDYRKNYNNEECLNILREGYEELLRREAIFLEFEMDLHREFVSQDIENLPISEDKQTFYADTSICKGAITGSNGAYLDNFGTIRFDDSNICY